MCTSMELRKSVQTLKSMVVNVTFPKEPLHFISHMPCWLGMCHYQEHTDDIKMVWKEWDFFRLTEPHGLMFTLCSQQESLTNNYTVKSKKVKCSLVQALRLCTGRTAHRGSRGIALPFLDHCTKRGEGLASRPGCSLPPGKDPVPIVWEVGWAPEPVWTGEENLAPHQDFIPGLSSP